MSERHAASGFIAVCLLIVASATSACHRPYDWAIDVGREMDSAAKGLEQYGTVSMSAPLLFVPDDRFAFDLNRTALEYYNDARTDIHAGAARFVQEAVDRQFGLQVQVNVAEMMSALDALSAYRGDLSDYQRGQALQKLRSSLSAILPVLEAADVIKGLNELDEAEDDPDGERQKTSAEILIEALRSGAGAGAEGLPTTRPAFPDVSTHNAPEIASGVLPTTRPAQGVLDRDKFRGFMELLGDDLELKLPNRSAIITASGDKVTQALLQILGDPQQVAPFEDKSVMFAVAMVSVSPGRLTQKDYAADVAVTIDYSGGPIRAKVLSELRKTGDPRLAPYTIRPDTEAPFELNTDGNPNKTLALRSDNGKGRVTIEEDTRDLTEDVISVIRQADSVEALRKFFDPDVIDEHDWNLDARSGRGVPYVAAVSPMTETQTLDLKSSMRRQRAHAVQIAVALSGLGAEVQSKYFKDWVKREEEDAASLSAVSVVSSYSVGGNMFGYQIIPRMKAMGAQAANQVLDPLTFPVLIIVGIDRADVAILVSADESDRPVLNEPQLVFSQTSRWRPLRESSLFQNYPRISEQERMRWAAGLYRAWETVNSRARSPGEEFDEDLAKIVENRIWMLEYHALGSVNTQYLPLTLITRSTTPRVPVVRSVYPQTLQPLADGSTHSVVLLGDNMGAVKTVRRVIGLDGAVSAEMKVTEEAVHLRLKLDKVTATQHALLELVFEGPDGKETTTLSLPIKVIAPPSPGGP